MKESLNNKIHKNENSFFLQLNEKQNESKKEKS